MSDTSNPHPRLRLLKTDGEESVASPISPTDSRNADGSSRRGLLGIGQDIRTKILSLVLLSSLAPALIVGAASYMTARKILDEKASDQLTAQALDAAQEAARFFANRDADTRVFASAPFVAEQLDRWTSTRRAGDAAGAHAARGRIRQYMDQVKERYPFYRALYIVDSEDAVISSVETDVDGAPPGLLEELQRLDSRSLLLDTGGEPRHYSAHPIYRHDDTPVGTLIAASGLDELWRSLAGESRALLGELRVIDSKGLLLFDTRPDAAGLGQKLGSEAARRCLEGGSGVAQYLDERGRSVLGAYRYLAPRGLGFVFEITSDEAFAATRALGKFNLVASLLAAGLVTGIGFALALSLIRPVEALIRGAKAVSDGDLSQQIPVGSDDQIGYLTTIFNRMTRSLLESRARLEEISQTDELTDLPNRRHLAKKFTIELGRTRRSGRPLSVLIIDFDHFKEFNDRFGHLQGDSLLREASQFLAGNLRPTDVLARFGGEEFVILLPDTAKDQAIVLAERLRAGFAQACSDPARTSPWVTISVGVATSPEDGETRDALLRKADSALYKAKQQGRNQVQVAV